jgi:hypothetical protein
VRTSGNQRGNFGGPANSLHSRFILAVHALARESKTPNWNQKEVFQVQVRGGMGSIPPTLFQTNS